MKRKSTQTIGELCDFINGHGFTPRDWQKNGLPIIRIQNLNGSREFNYFAGVPDPRWIVEPGDLLFAWAGTRGVSFGIFEWKGPRGVLNQHILRVIPKAHVDRDWLMYALHMATQRIERMAHGFKSTLLHVRRSDITDQPIKVPSQEEQRYVASVLNIACHRVSVAEQVISYLQIRRQGLMQQLLTGKRRFSGFTGKWRSTTIGDVLREVDRPIEMRDLEVYRLASVRRNWEGLFERGQLYGREIKTKNLREIRAGDFLISHIQAAYGSLALVPSEFDGYKVSDMYTCLVPRDSSVLDIRFFAYLAQQPRMTYLCRTSSNGFFAERLRLNFMPEAFLQQPILIPPTLDEQQHIITTLQTSDREIAVLRRLLNAYQQQQTGLMQQMLTRKRRAQRQPAAAHGQLRTNHGALCVSGRSR